VFDKVDAGNQATVTAVTKVAENVDAHAEVTDNAHRCHSLKSQKATTALEKAV
jgi:hypothetical protein